MGRSQSEVAQESHQVISRRIALSRRKGRLTITAHVIADDPVMAGERLELVVPHAGVQRMAVNEHEGVSRAGHLIVETGSVDMCEVLIPVHRALLSDKGNWSKAPSWEIAPTNGV
jgi:hypothetical protein